MITQTSMLYLYVETPLHAGTGSGLSSIDLPIQRERTTQYPTIQGSGIKGKLRGAAQDYVESLNDKAEIKHQEEIVTAIFGTALPTSADTTNATNPGEETARTKEKEPPKDFAGAMVVGDARLLLFPVRSLSGVFAYVTSEDVLNRFVRDIKRGNAESPTDWGEPEEIGEQKALVTSKSEVCIKENQDAQLVLEEFSFTAKDSKRADKIAEWLAKNALPDGDEYTYWRKKIQSSLVILTDNDFRDFVLYATEIITRIKLDRATKTVTRGALWTEEHLPTDTLLYVPLYATNARSGNKTLLGKDILEKAHDLTVEKHRQGYLQLGGDETVGRGIVRMHWSL